MKRKRWLFALLLLPLALAIPLYLAASWRPHAFGVHPFARNASAITVVGARPVPARFGLRVSPDGSRLLSMSVPSYGLAMWSVRGERVIWKKPPEKFRFWQPLCFSSDGRTLAMSREPIPTVPFGAKGNPALALFDANSGRQIAVLPVKSGVTRFQSATFSPDGRRLVAASDVDVRVWDVAARREIARLPVPPKISPHLVEEATIMFNPTSQLFLAKWQSGSDPSLSVLTEMRDLQGGLKWKESVGEFYFYTFSPDGTRLLASERNSLFELRESLTNRVLWKRTFGGIKYMGRAWTSDGSAVVVDSGNAFEVLDAQTGDTLRTLAHANLQAFVIAPDDSIIYSIDDQGQLVRQRLN